MTREQKQANVDFFNMITNITKDGGTYVWPQAGHSYTIDGNKFVGNAVAIKAMKNITLESFHSRLIVG